MGAVGAVKAGAERKIYAKSNGNFKHDVSFDGDRPEATVGWLDGLQVDKKILLLSTLIVEFCFMSLNSKSRSKLTCKSMTDSKGLSFLSLIKIEVEKPFHDRNAPSQKVITWLRAAKIDRSMNDVYFKHFFPLAIVVL